MIIHEFDDLLKNKALILEGSLVPIWSLVYVKVMVMGFENDVTSVPLLVALISMGDPRMVAPDEDGGIVMFDKANVVWDILMIVELSTALAGTKTSTNGMFDEAGVKLAFPPNDGEMVADELSDGLIAWGGI